MPYEPRPHAKAKAFGAVLGQALQREPLEVFSAYYAIAVFGDEGDVLALSSDGALAERPAKQSEPGVIVTAQGGSSGFDFVSRFFVPGKGIAEDPVQNCVLGR